MTVVPTTIIDLDIYGNDRTDGNPIVHYNEDAVKNALILWLTSKKGDFLWGKNMYFLFYHN